MICSVICILQILQITEISYYYSLWNILQITLTEQLTLVLICSVGQVCYFTSPFIIEQQYYKKTT